MCVEGDNAVSHIVTVSGHPTCHSSHASTERSTQSYYYRSDRKLNCNSQLCRLSHSLWLMSSFWLFGWCGQQAFCYLLTTILLYTTIIKIYTFTNEQLYTFYVISESQECLKFWSPEKRLQMCHQWGQMCTEFRKKIVKLNCVIEATILNKHTIFGENTNYYHN